MPGFANRYTSMPGFKRDSGTAHKGPLCPVPAREGCTAGVVGADYPVVRAQLDGAFV